MTDQEMLQQFLAGRQEELKKAEEDFAAQKVDPYAKFGAGLGQVLQGRPVDTSWADAREKLAYDSTLGKLKLQQQQDFQNQLAISKLAEDKRQSELSNAFREKSLQENISARRDIAKQNQLQRQDIMAQQAAQKLETRKNQLADKEEKKKSAVTEIEDRYRNITDSIGELKNQLDETGSFELFGPENKNMDQYITNIATDMAKLVDPNSVARESEVASFKKMLFEPTLWTRNSTLKGVLDNFKNIVDKRMETAYKVRGLEQPVRPKSEEIKVINGEKYKKVEGGWEKM